MNSLVRFACLVDIGQFIIRLHEWLVAPVCEVEGHIKKVDDLLVSFDCDFKAIGFEHLADFLLVFFNFFRRFVRVGVGLEFNSLYHVKYAVLKLVELFYLWWTPALQLSAVKNEFPSEGLRVFNEEHPAGK